MTKVNTSTGAVAGTFPVGKQPRAVTFDGATSGSRAPAETRSRSCLPPRAPCSTPTAWAATQRACVQRHLPCGSLISSQNRLKRINTNGVHLSSTPIGPDDGDTLAFDGTNMWVANSAPSVVRKISPTGTLLLTAPVAANPVALAFDGADVLGHERRRAAGAETEPRQWRRFSAPTRSRGTPSALAFGRGQPLGDRCEREQGHEVDRDRSDRRRAESRPGRDAPLVRRGPR